MGTRRCSVIITNESERGGVKQNEGETEQERKWKTKEEERSGRDIKGELLLADIQTTRGVTCTRPERETSQLQRAIFRSGDHAITRVEDSSSRKSGTTLDV